MTNQAPPPAAPLELSAATAFVVHVGTGGSAEAPHVFGRVEHVASGDSMRFGSAAELVRFMCRALATTAAGAVLALGLLLSGAGQAAAAPLSRGEQACVTALYADGGKLGQEQGKQSLACLTSAARGERDGSAQACLGEDPKGKLALRRLATLADEAAKCAVPPAFAHAGGEAVNAAAARARLDALADLFGDDLDAAVLACAADSDGCGCQATVAKSMEKLLNTKWKRFEKCAKRALATAASADEVAACVDDAGLAGSVAAQPSPTKALASVVAKRCDATGVTAGAFGAGRCAGLEGAALAACLGDRADCRVCEAARDAGALPLDCDLFDDGAANGSCAATVPCDGTTCGGECVAVLDETPEAEIDEPNQVVCADTCLATTSADAVCGAGCDGGCGVGEACIEGECRCRPGGRVCAPLFPTKPDCVDDERSTCEFLAPSGAAGTPPYHYSIVRVRTHQDTPVYFHLRFTQLFPAGTDYIPYVAACDGERGRFEIPGDTTQARVFDDDGRVSVRRALVNATTRDPRCEDPDFRALPKSNDIAGKGYYIGFTPRPGEHGADYNRLTIVVDHGGGTSGTFEVVYVFVDVLPGPAPAAPPLPAGVCGNGVQEGDEECEPHGPSGTGAPVGVGTCRTAGLGGNAAPACTADCRLDTTPCAAACGDGVALPVEACDGADLRSRSCESFGYAGGALACNATCDGFDAGGCRAHARAFVTSQGYDGNLGGLTGADAVCTAHAGAADLGGTWRAWLSASGADARSRIAGGAYRLTDDVTVVAADGADLFDGTLAAPLARDEDGNAVAFTQARTGTNGDGSWSGASCGGWTNDGGVGTAGRLDGTTSWTAAALADCGLDLPLYCFERVATRRVFVSSLQTTGAIGGLGAADAFCQSRAQAAKLGGGWRAWLSNDGFAAAERIPDARYVLVDGTVVAHGKADLLDGSLAAAIDRDELGAPYHGPVWTGTNANGSRAPANCDGWGLTLGSGTAGTTDEPPSAAMAWTSVLGGPRGCGESASLYCFEQ